MANKTEPTIETTNVLDGRKPPIELAISNRMASDALSRYKTQKERIENYKITTDEEFQQCAELLNLVKSEQKTITAQFEPVIRPLYDDLEAIYEDKRNSLKPYLAAEKVLKQKMSDWQLAQRKKQLEEAKRLAEIEAKQRREREEAERALAIAESQRIRDAQAKAKIEEAQKRLVQAETKIVETAITKPVSAPSKAAGVTTTFSYSATVVDLGDFMCGIIDGVIPPNMCAPNLSEIAKFVKDNPDEVKKWPGVTVTETAGIRGR